MTPIRIFLFVILCSAFLLCISDSGKSEEISLHELNYELYSHASLFGEESNFSEIYDTDEYIYFNYSDTYGYYDCNDGLLLCDIDIFNYTKYDYLYITLYNPDDNDLTVRFRQSYIYGSSTGNIWKYVIDKNEYYQSWYKNNPLTSNTSMNHISMFYNYNNYTMLNHRFVDMTYIDGYKVYPNDVLSNVDYNLEWDVNDNSFQTFQIKIRDNFDYTNSQLRFYNYIELRNVSSNIYMKDWGFGLYNGNSLDYIPYEYENVSYYPLYGRSNYFIDMNLSNYSYTEYGYGNYNQSMYGFSIFDSEFNYYSITTDIATYTNGANNYRIWKYYIYDTAISLAYLYVPDHTFPFASLSLVTVQDSFYAYPGWTDIYHPLKMHYYLNENDFSVRYKYYFNREYSSGSLNNHFNTDGIYYENPKMYYGFFINNTIGNYTLLETNEDTYELNDYIDKIDTVQSNSEQNSQEYTFYKIKGDWSAFDSIRKGLNKVLEVIQIILYAILSFFSPLFDVLDSIISVFEAISQDMLDLLQPFFNAIQVTIDTIDSNLQTLSFTIGIINSRIATILSDVADILTELGAITGLLTVIGWVQDIIDVIVTVSADILTMIQEFVSILISYVTQFIQLLQNAFSILEGLLFIYLMIVTGFMLMSMNENIETGQHQTGEIVIHWVYLCVLPLIVLFQLVLAIGQTIISLVPG